MRKAAALVMVLALASLAEGQSGGIDSLPGWSVVSDTELFGEQFVAEFEEFAPKFIEQLGYTQQVPDDHRPTLEAVEKRHGKATATVDRDQITGVETYRPVSETIRFHVYGRFGVGVELDGPPVVRWVKMFEAPAED